MCLTCFPNTYKFISYLKLVILNKDLIVKKLLIIILSSLFIMPAQSIKKQDSKDKKDDKQDQPAPCRKAFYCQRCDFGNIIEYDCNATKVFFKCIRCKHHNWVKLGS
jgi:hypothetical protein